jgi:hypothetical protein
MTEQEESLNTIVYYSVTISKLNTAFRQVLGTFQKKVRGGGTAFTKVDHQNWLKSDYISSIGGIILTSS